MKTKAGIIFYLIFCTLIVTAAIFKGMKHPTDCPECRAAISRDADESAKFAEHADQKTHTADRKAR